MDLCQQIEMSGASFVTVHGRTRQQRCEPVSTSAVKTIKDSVSIPVIHNGDVTSLESVERLVGLTGADGKCGLVTVQQSYSSHIVNIQGE